MLKYIAVAVWLSPTLLLAQAEINGTVQDADGEPLQGAHVILNQNQTSVYTDVLGAFAFRNLQSETYKLKVTYIGYEDYSQDVDAREQLGNLKIILNTEAYLSEEVVVEATRLSPKAPATFQNIPKQEIAKLNLGQDLPFLLNWTPSLVATSDAGAGVGYTGMRIRGSDQTRINVTVNGIPINDPESQGVFWVNMPDFSTSLSSLQIQRGLGSSTNGSGAFGASINMETSLFQNKAGAQISNSYGSFNTQKNTVQFNSGLMKNNFAIEGRLSRIHSAGYIDRASSDLKSYFLSAGYFGKNTVVKAITFSGKERTYQSWYGTPQSRLDNDVDAMRAHASNEGYTDVQTQNLLNAGRTYNFYLYDNQVDDYQQDHYQLHLIQQLAPGLNLALAGHYTYGRGFFEEYKSNQDYAGYGKAYPIIGNDTIFSTDLIRRRWLQNDFYGATYALTYETGRQKFILGGGSHFYRGDHFGEIVWAEVSEGISHLERYYQGTGNKDDVSVYAKWEAECGRWLLMADAQVRGIKYDARGTDNDQSLINVFQNYLFLNPKIGARYVLNQNGSIYAYLGRGNREPVRTDFIDAPTGEIPKAETLNNLEFGYAKEWDKITLQVNGYYMDYENQLVLTGELNDVGSSLRRNVANSYRMGIEIDATYQILKNLSWNANATFSRNKIENFQEVLYDYSNDDFGILRNDFADTDISFSPSIIAASRLNFMPFAQFEINLISKYVGQQYLDNTQSESKSIDAYFVSDVRLAYHIDNKLFKSIDITLLINNFLSERYNSNGYTYSYIADKMVTENFYYPQAGTNFLVGLTLKF